jgi:hypothetical protein
VGGGQAEAAGLMVGRDRELARVTRLLDDALEGRGRLVLCTGEAGIGKTRLAEEIAASAAARDVPVAWARAADRDSSPPCGLWQLVLEEPAVRGGADDMPLWPDVLRDGGRAALADGADSGIAQRFALFAGVRRRLTNKQIGETLFVSERTAENHVQHILVKLGFSNRSQIAAWSSTVTTPPGRE